jgi:uncharacterized membrane protein HdeD (DUF308 family)
MKTKIFDIPVYLGYVVATITILFGIVLLTGFVFQYVPAKLRITFGVVLILWGIYRIVYTRMRKRMQETEEDGE